LRSALLGLTWYEYVLLDVIAVLALAVGSVVLIVYMTLRAVLGKICGGGRRKDEDKVLRKRKGTKGDFSFHICHIFTILGCCSPSMEDCFQMFRGRVLASTSIVV